MSANVAIVPKGSPEGLSVRGIDSVYINTFKRELTELLIGVKRGNGGPIHHMTQYDYSSIVPANRNMSGADLWERVTMLGGTSGYYLPTAEGNIVDQNTGYFSRMFTERPTVIDLGPGGDHAGNLKSIPTQRAVSAKRSISIDLNGVLATRAANAVSERLGIPADPINADFTKPLHIPNMESPVFLMMYGGTLGQFPLSNKKTKKPIGIGQSEETTLIDLLNNLGAATDYRAVMAATIDTQQHEGSALDCYMGQHFREFKVNLWRTAQTLVELDGRTTSNHLYISDAPDMDIAQAFTYSPRFEKDRGIVHAYIVERPVRIGINGANFDIPAGQKIETGISEKSTVEAVARDALKAGWKVVHELSDGRSTVRELIMLGKNLLNDPIEQARLGHSLIKTSGAAAARSSGGTTMGLRVAQLLKTASSPRRGLITAQA